VCAGHVCLDRGLIDKDQALRIKLALVRSPTSAPTGHVGAIPFAGVQAFLKLSLARVTKCQTP
jgi:hypothetical protein